jgi:Bacterial Ig-like domain (group 2)
MAGGWKPAATAETTASDPVGDQSYFDDEAVQATLAGIAVELETWEQTEHKSRHVRFAAAAGFLIAIVLVAIIARSRLRDRTFISVPAVAPPLGASGEVGKPQAIAPRPLIAPPVTKDTSGPLSRNTVSTRHAARVEQPPPPVSDVDVTPSGVSVRVSHTTTLTATLTDEDGNEITGRRVSWTSSRPGVATVSSKGVVRGRAPGRAMITAKSGGKQASALVIVTRQSTTKSRR